MFAVCALVSRDGVPPRHMQRSAGAGSNQNAVEGAHVQQSKHGGRQTKGSASNEHWRREQRQHGEMSTADVNTAESSSAANSRSGHHNLQSAIGRPECSSSGPKKGSGKMKASKDKAPVPLQQRHTSSTPTGASSKSPAMPQSASVNHRVPASMSFQTIAVL